MFAVLEIPDFSLQALLRLRPGLRDAPVAILRGEGRRAVVSQANTHAHGISAGATVAQALADCPSVQLLAPSLDAEREAGALLLSAAWSLSPCVEPSAPGCCTVDLTGADLKRLSARIMEVLAGLEGHGLQSRAGIGPTPLVARYASHLARPMLWVDDSRKFLHALPIELLTLTKDEALLFADLGLRTLGSIAAFPRASLTSRLGYRGDELWAKAAGLWHQPIQPAPHPNRHIATTELEEPIETLEPLLFVLRRFCERLAEEVGQFGGGTSRLSLTLHLDNEQRHTRVFELPEPTAKPDLLFKVLESHLASLQTEAAIVAAALEVFPARRLEQQEGFFDTGLRDAPMFYATLGRLAAVVGAENVGTLLRRDALRPDAISLRPPLAMIPERSAPAAPEPHGPLLWRLRPPVPATVELTEAEPTFLASTLATGNVTVLRRPFRSNGEWWSPDEWAREEWDLQVGNGLYRLLHEPGGWSIEGIYD